MTNSADVRRNVPNEIDLLQLFWAIARKWRVVIVSMVILGLLCGVYKGVTGYMAINDEENDAASAIQTYELLVQNNKTARQEAVKAINKYDKQITDMNEYLKDSVLMNIDPYEVHVAGASYYVKTGYEIMPELTYQNIDYTGAVVTAYVNMLTDESYLSSVVEKTGIDYQYLSEIVSVYGEGNGIFSIQVNSYSDELSKDILNGIIDNIPQCEKVIAGNIADHSIAQLTQNVYTTRNESILEAQVTKNTALLDLRTAMSDEQKYYNDLKNDAKSIEEPDYTDSALIRNTVKFVIIGAMLGCIVSAGYYTLVFVAANKVNSGQEMTRRTRIKVLADVASKPKHNGRIDNFIRRMDLRPMFEHNETAIAMTVNRIKGMDAGIKNVLVAGQAPEYIASDITGKLNANALQYDIHFDYFGSILTSAESAAAAKKADVILLVEKVDESGYSDIENEIVIAGELEKKIVGAVVVD